MRQAVVQSSVPSKAGSGCLAMDPSKVSQPGPITRSVLMRGFTRHFGRSPNFATYYCLLDASTLLQAYSKGLPGWVEVFS